MRKRRKTIPLFWPYMTKKTRTAVRQTLKTRWLGQGPMVDEFEAAFGQKFGYDFCISMNSATSALEVAYRIIGLEPGDEVISPVLTCSATNVPLARNGVKIVFADIDKKTLCIDWEDVKKKITPRTKAVVAVNLGGIDAFQEGMDLSFLRDNGIKVVTDSAQSLGKTHGDYIVYSFQAIKHITTGDGGMLIVNNQEDYERAKRLRWYGIDREARQRNGFQMYKGREMTMDIEEVGYKFHMNDIAATLGYYSFLDYDSIMAHRQSLFDRYVERLSNVEGVSVVNGPNNTYWLATFLFKNRDVVAKKLKEWKVETNLVQIRNDVYTAFGGELLDLPNMNEIESKYLCLPLNPKVTLEDVDYICDVIELAEMESL